MRPKYEEQQLSLHYFFADKTIWIILKSNIFK